MQGVVYLTAVLEEFAQELLGYSSQLALLLDTHQQLGHVRCRSSQQAAAAAVCRQDRQQNQAAAVAGPVAQPAPSPPPPRLPPPQPL